MSRFHQAARDGYLDLLREANKKECNSPDEDGVTPTLLAAACGNLDALRLLVGRGGDPDKCDHFGNSALHWAAGNGHINCVSFLVNFGVNLWTLDNTHLTAKELAGIKGQKEILRFLDNEAAKQSGLNKKNVQSLKEKAVRDADKRIKEYEKLQKRTIRKAEKEDRKIKKDVAKMYTTGENGEHVSPLARPSISIPVTGLRRDSHLLYAQPSFSDLVNSGNGSVAKKSMKGGVAGRIQKKKENGTVNGDFKVREIDSEGKRSVRSITGLRRDSEVMYVPKFDTANGNGSLNEGRKHVGEIFTENGSRRMERIGSEPYLNEPSSMFERPGLGNLTFRQSLSGTLMSIPPEFASKHKKRHDDDEDSAHASDMGSPSRSDDADSIGSAGSLARTNGSHRTWYSDDRDDGYMDDSALETFLTAHDLRNCLPYLRRERVDLKALLLLTENDLKEINLPMGIRKKMMEAINRRKQALFDAGDVYDSRL